jgi:chromatin remodeling complex protein RSC6
MQLSCKHILHTECGLGWIIEKKTCPLCRQETLAKKHLPHAEDAPIPVKRKVKRKPRRRRPIKTEDSGLRLIQPVKISAEMAEFTGRNRDELHSRINITKYVCRYIKNNNLQNNEDCREIFADSRLRKLLHCRDDDEPLTYYNLHKHIQKHYS